MLRDYKPGDEAEIYRLVKSVLADYDLETNLRVTDVDLSNIADYYLRGGGCFKVIEIDGKIVGSYGVFVRSADICELRKMYLLPAFQGCGLGRIMMEDALEFARKNGFKAMFLETNSRLKNAIRLYQRYGFRPVESDNLSDRCDGAMKLSL